MTTQLTTSLVNWISPSAMHALGWALLHFVWQGTALAAFAAVAMAVSRRTQVRYLIGVATLALMLLAPAATFVLYLQQNSEPPRISQITPVLTTARATLTSISATVVTPARSAITSLDSLPWLVEAWLIGVAFFSLRSAGGFLLLERERRRQSSVVEDRVLEICYSLQDRLGIKRGIQYCECKWLQTPAVVGWFRPVVFFPATVLTGLSEEQLQAVIAHELAHIKRLDAFVNVFEVVVETLLFYHPAVWWLNKRIRAEREHCCDERAVSVCGNAVEYARALTLMEEWRSAPALAMAANHGPLAERVTRVLGLKTLGAGMRSIGVAGSLLCVTAALGAGSALLSFTRPAAAQASSLFHAAARSQIVQQPTPQSAPPSKPSAAKNLKPSLSAGPAPTGTSYIDAMKAAGLPDLGIDDLIALKTQ